MNKLLILILFLAFLLRIININSNPAAMYGDELTMAYDVKSIIETGYDQTGKFLPLNFSMGGGRPVGYGYFSIPFIWLFGTSEVGIRSLSILSGLGLVILMYLLGSKLFSQKVGLIAAILTTISPWDIAMSRGGFEAHFALFLMVMAIWMIITSRFSVWRIILSALFLLLAMHTYSTYKLIAVIFLPVMFWFAEFGKNYIKEKLKYFLGFFAILFVSIGLIVFQAIFIGSESRFESISIFGSEEIKNKVTTDVNYHLNNSVLPLSWTKLFYNKPLEYFVVFGKSYLEHFSTEFLFLSGDKNPRHNGTTSGQLYAVEVVTILLGFGYLWRKSNKRNLIFLMSWLLIAPLASALTGSTHALRANFMLPPLLLISALGIAYVNFGKVFLITAFIIQFVFIMHRLFFVSGNEFSRFWSYPAKDAVGQIQAQAKKFQYVIVSDSIDNIEYAYEVYANVDPRIVLDKRLHQKLNNRNFKKFGSNIYLGSISEGDINSFLGDLPGSAVYVGPVAPKNSPFAVEYKFNKDGEKAYVIIKKI